VPEHPGFGGSDGAGGVPQWLPFFEALAERYLKSAIVGLRSAPRSILRRR